MSKITLTYEKNEYVLEFNRQSVKTMEAQGFVLDEIATKPGTMIPALFAGAFMKNNRGIKRSLIDDIFDNVVDKSGLVQALVEMYAETLSTLMEDAEEKEGNATWTLAK